MTFEEYEKLKGYTLRGLFQVLEMKKESIDSIKDNAKKEKTLKEIEEINFYIDKMIEEIHENLLQQGIPKSNTRKVFHLLKKKSIDILQKV